MHKDILQHTWVEDRICTEPLPMMMEKAPASEEAAANCFSPVKGTMLLPVMVMLRWRVSVAPGATLPAVPLPAAQMAVSCTGQHLLVCKTILISSEAQCIFRLLLPCTVQTEQLGMG